MVLAPGTSVVLGQLATGAAPDPLKAVSVTPAPVTVTVPELVTTKR